MAALFADNFLAMGGLFFKTVVATERIAHRQSLRKTMTLQNAQKMMYASTASANSEVTDWRPSLLEARASSSCCEAFLCVAVFLMGGLHRESQDSPLSLSSGTPTCAVCPPQLALELAGFENLLKETAMYKPLQLSDAFKALANHTLTTEQAKSARLCIESIARTLMQAATESNDFELIAETILDFYKLSYLFASEEA